jgi:hypothetical protein
MRQMVHMPCTGGRKENGVSYDMNAAVDLRKAAFADMLQSFEVADHLRGGRRRLARGRGPACAQLVAGWSCHGSVAGRPAWSWPLSCWIPRALATVEDADTGSA